MEATKVKWHNVDIAGKWKLVYKTSNTQGPQAFGGKHLGLYKSPFDRTAVYLRDVNYTKMKGFMIDSLKMDFTPDTNPDHKLLISWLICHPEVKVVGVKNLPEEILRAKDGTNKIHLICEDYLEMEQIDDEDFIDKVIGILSLDTGKYALGLAKIRYIMAELGFTYYVARYEGDAEKKVLRTKLKTYVRKSIENAKQVSEIINNLDGAKDSFEFKEMVRLKVLEMSNGLYKFNNAPCGDSFERVNAFFNNHPEVKASAIERLYKLIESEN